MYHQRLDVFCLQVNSPIMAGYPSHLIASLVSKVLRESIPQQSLLQVAISAKHKRVFREKERAHSPSDFRKLLLSRFLIIIPKDTLSLSKLEYIL